MTSDSDILSQEIQRRTAQGWMLVSQTGAEAQMRKQKQFSFLWAFLWFLLAGFGLLIYLLYYISKKDQLIYIRVQNGALSVTNS